MALDWERSLLREQVKSGEKNHVQDEVEVEEVTCGKLALKGSKRTRTWFD